MADLRHTRCLIGTGGVGTGLFYEVIGNHTLGRDESRGGYLKEWQDYCKLHIIAHNFTVLTRNRAASGHGIRVIPVGKVGDDPAGQSLLRQMKDVGMDCSYMGVEPGAPTLHSTCFIYPDSSGGNITAVNSASGRVSVEDIAAVRPLMQEYSGEGIALAAPEVPIEARRALLELATKYAFFRAASFTGTEVAFAVETGLLTHVDLLAINVDEAQALFRATGESGPATPTFDTDAFRSACIRAVQRTNPKMMLTVTLGSRGAYAIRDEEWDYVPPLRVDAVNTAGAGDAFFAGTLVGLINGRPFIRERRSQEPLPSGLREQGIETAVDYAALVAAFSVTSPHSIAPDLSPDRLVRFADEHGVGFA